MVNLSKVAVKKKNAVGGGGRI